ncbi:rhodopsin [Echeneis naucrates]|uniref:rhodopsin n=1 Tax=Echeneis naucrates TaxID=173247 RepID=UPI00111383D9|nr:rhodopsin-like [Echeneis naucrates]
MDTEDLIESIIRAFMFLAGIVGNNWLAVCSLSTKKSGLHTSEVLFINLAVSNLITNYLVDLPDTMADFAGRWFLGETYCGVFLFCADLSETSSIYTTFFISVFWHQKLVGSLKRGGGQVQLDSLRLVGCLLAGSWMVAVVFSIPHFFFVTVQRGNDSHEDCLEVFPNSLARQTYDIFYLTLANALPIAGIVFASVQIVITLLQNQRRIRGHSSDQHKRIAEDEENNCTEIRKNERPVSTDAGPGASREIKESASPSIYVGIPSSSCANEGLSGEASHCSPINRATNTDSRFGAQPNLSRSSQMTAKPIASSRTQVRAAKSVVGVAGVFLVCWLTHLLLRITNNIYTSSIVVEVASYIAASYTCIIPYIFLYGVKKLSFACKR